jgi:ribosomal-protein-alanine N-acetyltransferase
MSEPSIPLVPTLTGGRVRLRPLRKTDAEDFFALHADPRVMRYWSHPPWTHRDQAAERIDQLERDHATAEFYTWAATIDGSDCLIGTVSLFALNRMQQRAELGYALSSALWGQGYAREMVRIAIAFAFDSIGLSRLEADIDPRNEPSCRLVERVGFLREGLLRERWRVAGEVTDSVFYGLLRREYSA